MFRKTDVPVGSAVAVSDSTAQVTPKNYWPDGSLEFAVIAGVAALTANISQTVTLSVGTASSGTALTMTNLKTIGITAAIAAGAFGTVSWAITDWDSPFMTQVSGHQMSSWIYRKAAGPVVCMSSNLEPAICRT